MATGRGRRRARDDGAPAGVSGRPDPSPRTGLLLAVVCAAQFVAVVDDAIVGVATASIQSGLGLSALALPWVANGYLLTFGGLLLLAGRAADLYSRRALFVTGAGVFGAASLTCALASSAGMLVAARLVQGAGAALLSAAALTILTATFTGPARARALGAWVGVSGVAGVLGGFVGGALTSALSWRWVFVVNVPLVAVVIVTGLRLVPAARGGARIPLDVGGALTVTAGLALLLIAITSGGQAGWTSPTTVAVLGLAVLALAGFVLVERRHPHPLVPLHVFRLPTLTGANLCSLLLAATMLATFYVLSLFLQQVAAFDPVTTGAAYVPISAMIVAAAAVAPRFVARLGARPVMATGFVMIAGAHVWLAQLTPSSPYLGAVLAPSALAGAGIGAALVGVLTAATHDLGDDDGAGLSSGLVNTTYQAGGAIGIATVATVAATRTASGTAPGAPASTSALADGFGAAFATSAALAVVGAVIATVLVRGPGPSRPPP